MSNISENEKNLIYMLYCSVNNLKPDENIVKQINLEELYKVCKFHMVSATVCVALESSGIRNEKFNEQLKKSIRNTILFDIERQKIFQEFEQSEIWYLPLKGIIIKDLYPKNGMREMSDNDILYDKSKQQEVKEIMEKNGYHTETIGVLHHDTYTKPPVLNFELHTSLFRKESRFSTYYKNIEQKLIKDERNKYGYHLSDEDFYIFSTIHEFKHYSRSGTGIRYLLDCYVYMNAKKDTLNWNYITQEMKTLGIYDYEYKRRKIAEKIFSGNNLQELTTEEEKMLLTYLKSGVYGTTKRKVENGIEKEQLKHKNNVKIFYILGRVFPSYDEMKMRFPRLCKHKALLPLGYVWRLLRGILKKRKSINLELNEIKKFKE